MNVSALYGIRWIAKSTSDSFGLGLGAIPMWIIFMLIFFVPQALMCAELATAYPTDGGLNDWVKIAFGTKYGFLVSWMHWTALIFWYASFLTFFSINFTCQKFAKLKKQVASHCNRLPTHLLPLFFCCFKRNFQKFLICHSI